MLRMVSVRMIPGREESIISRRGRGRSVQTILETSIIVRIWKFSFSPFPTITIHSSFNSSLVSHLLNVFSDPRSWSSCCTLLFVIWKSSLGLHHQFRFRHLSISQVTSWFRSWKFRDWIRRSGIWRTIASSLWKRKITSDGRSEWSGEPANSRKEKSVSLKIEYYKNSKGIRRRSPTSLYSLFDSLRPSLHIFSKQLLRSTPHFRIRISSSNLNHFFNHDDLIPTFTFSIKSIISQITCQQSNRTINGNGS